MRYLALFFLIHIVVFEQSLAQSQNIADYGSFDREGDDMVVKDFRIVYGSGEFDKYDNSRLTLIKTSTISHSGSNSLFVYSSYDYASLALLLPISSSVGSSMFDPNKYYVVKAWIYSPSGPVTVEGQNYPTNSHGSRYLDPMSARPGGGGSNMWYCSYLEDNEDGSTSDKWTLIHVVFHPGEWNFFFRLGFAAQSIQNATYFFIDDVEFYELDASQIKDNAEIVVGDDGLGSIKINPTGGISGIPYVFKWADNSSETSSSRFGLTPGSYSVKIWQGSERCGSGTSFNYDVKKLLPLCEFTVPLPSKGSIKLDKSSGQIISQRGKGDCIQDFSLSCIQGNANAQLDKVVSASATTYSNSWSYDYLPVQRASGNAVERGELGKWRPQATYVPHKSGLSDDKNYNSGRYTLPPFSWQYTSASKKAGWVKDSEVTRYSPDGDAVEERNALNILSTAKYGYHDNIPYLIAKNAGYNDIFFESFETSYKGKTILEDGTPVTGSALVTDASHTGAFSYRLQSATPFTTRGFKRSTAFETRGMLIRLWAKGENLTDGAITAHVLENGSERAYSSLSRRARVGEWSLWEGSIPAGSFSLTDANNLFTVAFRVSSGIDTRIDDVRIQPSDSEMTCYVYDPQSLRLLATFSDQHFALLYQYNSEGQLVRKMIETERGVKTVQETQYNLPKKDKPVSE